MTFRQRLAQSDEAPVGARVSLAAMIDIVFLLLIFFLFGSFDFAEQQVITALTRDSAAAAAAGDPPIWLRVRPSSGGLQFAVDGQSFVRADRATEALAARCREIAHPTVVVDVAAGVKLQQLMDTFALARQAGAAKVAFRAEGDRF